MVGLLVVTHGRFSRELIKSIELIIGHQKTVEALTLDKYFVSNLNLAYTFKPRKVAKEITLGVTVYNLFNEEYENNGWASSSYDKDVNHRIDSAGYAAQAGTNVMGHVSFRF